MKLFSNCSECYICENSGGCLVGNGEDNFKLASKEKIVDNLDYGKYPDYEDIMIRTLKDSYGYDYDISRCNSKKTEDAFEYEGISLEDISKLF